MQSETHVVPSNNKAPTQVKHVVTVPEQVAHGEVHLSQDVAVVELINPVGQSFKHWFKCRIGYGLVQVVQLVVVPDQAVQFPPQV